MRHLVNISKGGVILLAMVGLVCVMGCAAKEPAKPAPPAPAPKELPAPAEAPKPPPPAAATEAPKPAAPAGWKLQFTETFDRADLGKDWEILAGNWTIEKGCLSGGSGTIMCTRDFPGAHRLEFDAQSDDPCDLTGIICANESGYEAGYFFGFGSGYNAYSKLLVEGAEMQQWETLITPGKIHQVVCQRDGNTLTHFVDGKAVMTYKDDEPLKGKDHQRVGFYIFTVGKIDNVKVYTKPE